MHGTSFFYALLAELALCALVCLVSFGLTPASLQSVFHGLDETNGIVHVAHCEAKKPCLLALFFGGGQVAGCFGG